MSSFTLPVYVRKRLSVGAIIWCLICFAANIAVSILTILAIVDDLMYRLYPINEEPVLRAPYPKPKEKLKKGEKMPPKNPGI